VILKFKKGKKMTHVINFSRIFLWIIAFMIVFSCDDQTDGDKKYKLGETAKRGGIRTSSSSESILFDTLRYDDGIWINRIRKVNPGDKLGVWFSPINRAPGCSLVAVQYFFNRDTVWQDTSVTGFVSTVPRYSEGGPSLYNLGSPIVTFEIPFSQSGWGQIYTTTVNLKELGKSVAVPGDSDLFAGWVTKSYARFPIGLADSIGNYYPSRSYRAISDDTLMSLNYDIGVRTIIECEAAPPDSGELTFELRWNQRDVDLDLFLIVTNSISVTSDTVYWDNRQINSGGKLNVDDNDGYGPEKITHPYGPLSTNQATLAVHYYGPLDGRSTRAGIILYQDQDKIGEISPCNLTPKDWWTAASIDLNTAYVQIDTTCNITHNSSVSKRRK